MLLIEHVQNAYHALRGTKMRTLLTTLGVAIGVASITTILSLSGGITSIVSNQVNALGGNIAVVRPGVPSDGASDLTDPIVEQNYTTSTVTESDLNDIKQIKGVDSAAPLMIINDTVKSPTTTAKKSTIVATTPAFENITNLPISEGQFIDSTTNHNTAVVGNQLALDIFGTDEPIGQTFTVRDQTFTVIGVLKPMNDPINFNNVDFDHAAIISFNSGKSFHEGIAQIQQIDVRAKSVKALPGVINTINTHLLRDHHGEKDFSILSGKDIAQPTSRFFLALTSVMTAVAAISLVVGGIGIMNIMLVGVAERTREIGLRKSVGASNSNIIWQFLIEALILSLLGGLLGYVGGYTIAFIMSTTFLTFSPAFTWEVAAASLGTSLVVGIIFGIYPALRAARKDPIESLRHYN